MKKSIVCFSLLMALSACVTQKPQAPEYTYKYIDAGEVEYNTTPQVYATVAERTTYKMLDDTRGLYEQAKAPKLYIMDVKKTDKNLPDGFYQSRKVTKDIIKGSHTFILVNSMAEADYYLETKVNSISLVQTNTPVIQYSLTLYNNKNEKINQWDGRIARLSNDDKSWW